RGLIAIRFACAPPQAGLRRQGASKGEASFCDRRSEIVRMALDDLVDRLERAAQVLADGCARSGLVALVDSDKDRLVIGENRLALAGRGQVQLAQAVEMAAAGADQVPQPGVPRGPCEAGVELPVELDESGEIIARERLALSGEQLAGRGDERFVGGQRQGAGDLELDGS